MNTREQSNRSLDYERERLLLEVTEAICAAMEEADVTKAELARRMGKHKSWLTKILSHRSNPTVKTLADLGYALGMEWTCELQPVHATSASIERITDFWASATEGDEDWTIANVRVPEGSRFNLRMVS